MVKRVKKICILLLAVVMLFANSMTVFAAVKWKLPAEIRGVYIDENNVLRVGTLLTSKCSELQKDFMREFFRIATGEEVGYVVVLVAGTALTFGVFDSMPTFIEIKLETRVPGNQAMVTMSGTPLRYLKFDNSTNEARWTPGLYSAAAKDGMKGFTAYGIVYCNFQIPENDWDIQKAVSEIIFSDDDGLIGGSDPEPEPEPDPAPLPPPKPPVTPPGDNTYVPYDTSAWDVFFKRVSGTTGNLVVIGLLIFGLLFAIGLLIKVVRIFSRKA